MCSLCSDFFSIFELDKNYNIYKIKKFNIRVYVMFISCDV